MIGQIFGRLSVMGLAGRNKKGEQLLECRCECGSIRFLVGHVIRNGHTKSCGCLQRDTARVTSKDLAKTYCQTIGVKTSQEYESWRSMWSRCTNKNNINYKYYKSRTPPESWRSFQQFLLDVGPRPSSKHSLDRVDNEKPYGPDNTVWALPAAQHRNTRANRWIEFGGERMILADWAIRLGLNKQTLRERLDKWPLSKALTQPKSIPHYKSAISSIDKELT